MSTADEQEQRYREWVQWWHSLTPEQRAAEFLRLDEQGPCWLVREVTT